MDRNNSLVHEFFQNATNWQTELSYLRAIAQSFPLTETLKWGKPCYSFEGRNIALMIPFKSYCGFLFFKGALIQDIHQRLVQAGENSQAARQLRFTGVQDIASMEGALRDYLQQAIAIERAGLKVPLKQVTEWAVPAELEQELLANPALKAAFHALTPGRQRAYLMHIGAAKQSRTRVSRVAKSVPLILAGRGIDGLPQPGLTQANRRA